MLIGVESEKKTNKPTAIPGVELKEGLEEKVINICLNHISPTITPEVKVCDFRSEPKKNVSDRAVLFIRVKSSYIAPHYLLKDNKISVRIHNRNSLADLPTIERLIERRKEIMSGGVPSSVSYDMKEINVEDEAYETIAIAPQFPSEPFINLYTREDIQWLSEITNEVMRLNVQKPGIWRLILANALDQTTRYCRIERTGKIAFQRRVLVEKDKFFSGESIILITDALKAVQKIYSRFGFYGDISVGLTIDNTKNLRLGFLQDDRMRTHRYIEESRCESNRIFVSKDLRYDELSHLDKKMVKMLRELCIHFGATFPEKTIEGMVGEVFSSLR